MCRNKCQVREGGTTLGSLCRELYKDKGKPRRAQMENLMQFIKSLPANPAQIQLGCLN
jgi:hypothetical protein